MPKGKPSLRAFGNAEGTAEGWFLPLWDAPFSYVLSTKEVYHPIPTVPRLRGQLFPLEQNALAIRNQMEGSSQNMEFKSCYPLVPPCVWSRS
jgi:hypothetical protein